MVGMRFGPEMVNLLVSSEDTATFLAKKFGVPDSLIRDAGEREQIMQAMQQMQQMQQMQGVANAGAAPPT